MCFPLRSQGTQGAVGRKEPETWWERSEIGSEEGKNAGEDEGMM